jgi:hypothetical protein
MDELGFEYESGVAITGVISTQKGKESKLKVALMGELDSVLVPDHPCADPITGGAHACGHNCQIASVVGAAIAIKEANLMEDLFGDIALMAVPSEEFVELEYRNKLREEGKTYQEVIDYLESVKRGVNPYFTTNTLTYLARGGRVTKIASIFGNILSIKPILRLNYDGKLLAYSKARGKHGTYRKLIEEIKKQVINPEEQVLYISHSNAIDAAIEFGELCKEELGFKDIFYSYIGSIIGSHTGPGLISAFFHGKNRFE